MKKQALFVFLGLILLTVSAFAETQIKAEVDRTTITTEELLTYKVIIASSEERLPEPEVPKFEGFSIVSQAQSSTVSFAKSKMKKILVYAFILAPLDAGKFKIQPAVIRIGNQAYSTAIFEIEVIQSEAQPRPHHIPQDPSRQPEESKVTL